MCERLVKRASYLYSVLNGISFAPSAAAPREWAWTVVEVDDPAGWLVSGSYRRLARPWRCRAGGTSRQEFIAGGATESAVGKTAWLVIELTMRHELMESFQYRGVRIFDPHLSVDELSMPHQARLPREER